MEPVLWLLLPMLATLLIATLWLIPVFVKGRKFNRFLARSEAEQRLATEALRRGEYDMYSAHMKAAAHEIENARRCI